MNARTKTLFHFTKKLDVLMLILQEGFWPQYSLEDISWIDGGVPRLAWPMVSFCDIPLTRLREHTEFYGDFGVGLCREQWGPTGLNPLLYVSPDSMLKPSLRELLLDVRKNPNERAITNAQVVLAHCKPLHGEMSVNGEKKEKNFYSECEWRLFPWVDGKGSGNYGFTMMEEAFRTEQIRTDANLEMRRNRMFEVLPEEVRYLLVKSVEDVPRLARFINEKLTHYPSDDLELLKTRIVVLEELSCDF